MYQPLQAIVPSYLYQEYADDDDLQAFVEAYNTYAQSYLDWFNQTPLSVYTQPQINGALLDFVALGLWSIRRPTLTTIFTRPSTGAWNSYTWNTQAWNSLKRYRSGTVEVVNDDIFKRVLTWYMYLGDGKQATLPWLKKRIMRFLFGPDGTDVSNDYLQYVSLSPNFNLPSQGAWNSYAWNSQAWNSLKNRNIAAKGVIVITLQNSIIAQIFQRLLQQGFLPLPIQVKYVVNLYD